MTDRLKDFADDLASLDFVYPMVLLLLIVPVTIAFWEWIRKGHPLVVPFDHGEQEHGRWLGWMATAAQMVPPMLLAVAIIILAGPQKPSVPEDEKVMSNIIFCLDISGSMRSQYQGKGITRYDAGVAAVEEFTTLEGREGDSFGLTVFGVETLHWVPVTQELEALRMTTEFVSPTNFPRWFGGTMIGRALMSCADVLQKQEDGDRLVILLSDGQSGDLNGAGLGRVIEKLVAANVTVYMISLQGGAINGASRAIAMETGGAAFSAADPEALRETFHRIDEMEKAEFRKKDPVPTDFFEPAILLGLLLLGTQLVLQFFLRYTPW